jgi:alpha-1,2-mannosyltransferase
VSTPSTAAGRAAPAVARLHPAFIAQAVLAGASIVIYAMVLVQASFHQQDLGAYLGAARNMINGRPLYAAFLQHPFPDPTLRPAYIYPPVFALLVTPVGLLPPVVAGAIWLILNQAALAATLWIVLRWLRPPRWAVAAIVVATVTFYPLWIDVVQGQANLPLLFLTVLGIAGVLRGDARFGVAIGFAAALKLTPALLLIWLVLDRRFRAAAWMLGGLVAASALAALVRFPDTVVFVERVVPALARGTAFYANQSFAGVMARIGSRNAYTDPWTILPDVATIVAAIALGLVVLWFFRTRVQPTDDRRWPGLLRAAAFLPLLPLLSSVTWPHHLVILLPVIWFVFVALAQRGWPAPETVAFCALLGIFSLVSRVPAGPTFGQPGFRAAQTSDPFVFLISNALFFGTLALFLLAPWLLRSR